MTVQRVTTTCLFLTVLLAGCGKSGPPPSSKATGQVTLNGQPVTEGEIYFVAAEKGYSANAALDSSGKYLVSRSLPPAPYKVFFSAPKVSKPPKPGEPTPETKPFVVPSQYLSDSTSGLTADVKAGDNQFDFKLE